RQCTSEQVLKYTSVRRQPLALRADLDDRDLLGGRVTVGGRGGGDADRPATLAVPAQAHLTRVHVEDGRDRRGGEPGGRTHHDRPAGPGEIRDGANERSP